MGCDICYSIGYEGFLIKYKKRFMSYSNEEVFNERDKEGYVCLQCLKEKLNNI